MQVRESMRLLMHRIKPLHPLIVLLPQREEWLMARILEYAETHGYSAYTSTLKEAWRLSIAGLSASLIQSAATGRGPQAIRADEEVSADPVVQFGMIEAQRHRERGVNLFLFLGLMKYYRQAYLDLVEAELREPEAAKTCVHFVNLAFDRIEIAFSVEWAGGDKDRSVRDLQVNNRMMTNEKNRYLTIFESIPHPVIIVSRAHKIDNMNLAAARMFKGDLCAGSQYYCMSRDRWLEAESIDGQSPESLDPGCFGGRGVFELMPWLRQELTEFRCGAEGARVFETTVAGTHSNTVLRVNLSKNLDLSGKFEGTIIVLEDITALKIAIEEVKTLRGFIPICAGCKSIRDDAGFWQQVEVYVQERSEATFSHSICPSCMKRLYPDLEID
jgi:PAS domain-containing protein